MPDPMIVQAQASVMRDLAQQGLRAQIAAQRQGELITFLGDADLLNVDAEQEVIDRIAQEAVRHADALLRALAARP